MSSWSLSRLESRFVVAAGSASPRPSGASRGSRRRCCCPPCGCRACRCRRVGRMAASRVRGIRSQSHLVASTARDVQSRHPAMVAAEVWSGCLSRQSSPTALGRVGRWFRFARCRFGSFQSQLWSLLVHVHGRCRRSTGLAPGWSRLGGEDPRSPQYLHSA
jgi:hypothetical protein